MDFLNLRSRIKKQKQRDLIYPFLHKMTGPASSLQKSVMGGLWSGNLAFHRPPTAGSKQRAKIPCDARPARQGALVSPLVGEEGMRVS